MSIEVQLQLIQTHVYGEGITNFFYTFEHRCIQHMMLCNLDNFHYKFLLCANQSSKTFYFSILE